MRKPPLDVAVRVGALVLALLLVPFLMVAGLAAFIVRALRPAKVRPAPKTACQGAAGDGPAEPMLDDPYARWLSRRPRTL